MTRAVYLLRGLPSAGKTTFGRAWVGDALISLDDHAARFRAAGATPGEADRLACSAAIDQACIRIAVGTSPIVLDGAFVVLHGVFRLEAAALMHGYRFTVLHVETNLDDAALAARNAHGCSVDAIARARARWQPYGGFPRV